MPRNPAEPLGNDLLFTSALSQAAMVRSGGISSEELVSLSIQRARDTAPAINCIAIPLYEQAIEQARVIDAALSRGENPGPLCGVPITLKDGIASQGVPQTFGSRSMTGAVADRDDIVWTRLKSAGAILIGKTTTPEFYHEVTTRSSLYGVTRNPWSLDHTPGGSSGGAAAALAAGVGSVAVGSDGGGSLRCPAACTGILALKPTAGRIPHESFPDTFGNYSSIGPMARSVEDLEMLFMVMSGPAERDALSLQADKPASASGSEDSVSGMRIGWLQSPGGYVVDPEIIEHSLAALAMLELAGASVRPDDVDSSLLDDVHPTYRVIGAVGHAGRLRQLGASARSLWGETFRDIVDLGMSYSASDLAQAQERRTALFRRVQHALRTVDVIAMPSLTRLPGQADTPCPVNGEDYAAWAAALYPFNLTGHPAISVPCGLSSEGLPIGIQFVARWHEEHRLFAVASALLKSLPDQGKRPIL